MKKNILRLFIISIFCSFFIGCNPDVYHTVNFETGCSFVIDSCEVLEGSTVPYPAKTPVRDGYEFLYWSTDANGSFKYDWSQPVKKAFTLYAVWKKTAEDEPEPVTPEDENPPQEISPDGVYVEFVNNSDFVIDIYDEPDRYIKLTSVEVGKTSKIPAKVSVAGSVYYLTYHVDIGLDVLWYDNTSYELVTPEVNKTVSIPLVNPESIKTTGTYYVIENCTTSSLTFRRGSTELLPDNHEGTIVNPGDVAIYTIFKKNFDNFPSFKIVDKMNRTISLPVQIEGFVSNTIYTITVDDFGAHLKSITPFDIDVKNQIWSSSNNSSKHYIECVRSAADVKNGTLMAGSIVGSADGKNYAPGSFFVKRYDVYGKESFYKAQGVYKSSERLVYDEEGEPVIDEETGDQVSKQYDVEVSKVLDILETKDGSILLLIQISFTEDNYDVMTNELVLYSFNPVNGDPNFVHNYSGILGEGKELIFRDGVQNRIVEIETNVFALACGLIDYTGTVNDYVTEGLYFAKLDCTTPKLRVTSITGLPVSNFGEGFESMFTSVFFDGTDFYVCGFKDCDFNYDESNVHSGIIYKISKDLTVVDEIYSKPRYLFFCIDGLSNGKYFVCGEEWGTVNNRLYGCYVSSDIVGENENPKRYSSISNKDYCWFNQLCAYSDRIILCGQSCDSQNGSEGSEPMVVCYNLKDEVQWENHKFTDYATAYSCFSNAIGTYNVYLYKEEMSGSEKIVTEKIVSADLLGNDTGVKKVLF